MKKIIIIASLIFLMALLTPRSHAENLYEEQSLSINTYKVQIDILQNGQLNVTENLNFDFQATLPFKWPIYASNISNIKIKNGGNELKKGDFDLAKSSEVTILTIKNGGNDPSWQISFTSKNQINYYAGFDELRWVAVFKNGANINEADILINLPADLISTAYQQKIYAFGVSDTNFSKINSRTLLYKATNIESEGSFTAVTELPKGLINPSLTDRFLSKLASLDILAGILISFIIFFLVWIILKLLAMRQRKSITPNADETRNKPPNDLPAALVGVLINKKINIREFAATILELARQGFLTIIKEEDRLYLIKRKPFDEASPAEKAMIDEIFDSSGYLSKITMNLADLKSSEKEKLSSQRISDSSEHIYSTINALEYFTDSPHEIYLKYLKISIIIFFIALIGLFITIFFINSYPVLIFISIGAILSSFTIPENASSLSLYTKRGKEVVREWLAFRNYLASGANNSKENLDEFFLYLPYTIVMHTEKKWAYQFSGSGFQSPNWLDTGYVSYDISDFVNKFLPLVYDLAYTLIETRTPTSR